MFVPKSLVLLKLNYWIKVFFAILTTPIKWNLIIIHDFFVYCKITNLVEHSLLDLCLFTLWNHPSNSNDFLFKLIHVCFVHYKSPWTNWNFTIGSTFLHCENMHKTKLSSNITIVLFIAKSPPWLKLDPNLGHMTKAWAKQGKWVKVKSRHPLMQTHSQKQCVKTGGMKPQHYQTLGIKIFQVFQNFGIHFKVSGWNFVQIQPIFLPFERSWKILS